MEILYLLLVGLVVGALARLIIPGRQPMGILGTMLAGVVGALLGWWAGDALFGKGQAAENPWIWATLGALLVVGVWAAVARRRSVYH